jgi:eukaryotic-like serine/threonine-protein kinase
LEVTGPGRPVIENIANSPNTGAAQFAFAADGTAVYLPEQTSADLPIQWMTRDGKTTPLRATTAIWSHPQFSPDGTRLAMVIGTIGDGRTDIAVYDWARDMLTPLTFGAEINHSPAWTPDSGRITFVSGRVADGRRNLYWVRADGGGDPQFLTDITSLRNIATGSWHPNGRFLAFTEGSGDVADLMILPMKGDEVSGWKPGKPYVFLKTPAAESAPYFSPDGRWLAYQSNESGRDEVYVRPFPPRDGRWLVSSGGGQWPTWSRAKRELLYQTLDNQIMAVPYTVEGDSFRGEAPRLWTERRILQRPGYRSLDLHRDGNRVAAAVATEGQAEDRRGKVVFIFHFFDELRRLAPGSP